MVLDGSTSATPPVTTRGTCRLSSRAAVSNTASTWPSTRKAPPPLSNLYVQMLRRLGMDTSTFGSAEATSIPGFDAA
ncbi:hypothetical protein CfE428DRAFT_0133 [Chthoniobacter flavus Ellin428]|uniref:Uncharacterized protein n=1 Tax=Chthoniobacter flavus Ellin428 TaxID=497964 RepID=B4CTX0_9BACT|nr:hypothetical protein [Chthoniobacter flavus]EDY22008.1 hypothetical protein CfE428DRAFT_0133 [Chthoniobacter flavus Ellin428]TCO89395.1 hypothetical protein EV701_114129 [Chthoniobacter flavus]